MPEIALPREAVRAFLLTVTAITDDLETYEFTTGNVELPAIFSTRVIPEDAKYPAIIIRQAGGVTFGTRGQEGGEFTVDVSVFDDKEANSETLDRLAQNIWTSLNRADMATELAAIGMENCGVIANPPFENNDDDGYMGYVISVTVRALVV